MKTTIAKGLCPLFLLAATSSVAMPLPRERPVGPLCYKWYNKFDREPTIYCGSFLKKQDRLPQSWTQIAPGPEGAPRRVKTIRIRGPWEPLVPVPPQPIEPDPPGPEVPVERLREASR